MHSYTIIHPPERSDNDQGCRAPVVDLWNIALTPMNDTPDRWTALLSEEERARALRFVFLKDQQRFAYIRGVLRMILARYCGKSPDALEFSYNRHGKPFLRDAANPDNLLPQFNLSHTENHALLAVSFQAPVGLDIEYPRELPDIPGILDLICSESEKSWLAACPKAERTESFWHIWTAKEALLKGEGTGFAHAPADVELLLSDPSRGGYAVSLQRPRAVPWHIQTFCPHPGYIAALAVQSAVEPQWGHWEHFALD